MKIILISGKAESGKTTTATILKELLRTDPCVEDRTAIVPYGAYVKDTAKLILGWDGKKDESGRTLLQMWGTDIVRKNNPTFWVDTVKRLADVSSELVDTFIIDDCRFKNEIDIWIGGKYLFITVRVDRPGYENSLTPEQRNHPSETDLDDFDFDVRLTATNKEELRNEIITKLLPLVKQGVKNE